LYWCTQIVCIKQNTFVDNIEKLTIILDLFGVNINVIPSNDSLFLFKQGIPIVLEYAINKTYKNKSRHNFINSSSSASCFGFVSHLQTDYTIVVWTIYYNAVSGFNEI
jgi:hypothetical protein